MIGAIIFGGIGIAACSWMLWKLSTAPTGFQHEGQWFPGTPGEWGIDPNDTE